MESSPPSSLSLPLSLYITANSLKSSRHKVSSTVTLTNLNISLPLLYMYIYYFCHYHYYLLKELRGIVAITPPDEDVIDPDDALSVILKTKKISTEKYPK